MSVTEKNHSFVMTAADDAITDQLILTSLRLVGTGMTLADRLTIVDNDAQVIFDYYVGAVNENAELIMGAPQWTKGIKLSAVPSHGTFTIIGRI